MTLKDLIMQTSFEKVSPEIKRISHGYRRPFTPESMQIYRQAFDRLKDIKPEPIAMKLHVKHHDVSGYYDEDVLKKMKEEDPETWEGAYGIGLTPWKYVLSMEIDSISQDWLSPEAIVANCLDEMLYYGFEEDWDLFLDYIKEQEAPEDEYANPNIVIHTKENGVATIFEGVTEIPDKYFQGASDIKTVIIPKSVTSIGDSAFKGCCSLSKVFISDVASWCKISFEDSLSNPLYYAKHLYLDGKEITELTIPSDVTSISNYAFICCSGLTSLTISNHVKSIGENAFSGCDGLTSVTIPNSVTTIGKWAFSDCRSLKSIVLPNSLSILEEGLFYQCSQLNSIVIPKSVKLIGRDIFENCSSLVSIHIPKNVEEIMPGQFRGCDNLISVVVDRKNPFYDSRKGCNAIIETKNHTLIAGCNKSMIPKSVVEIFDHAFDGCSGMTSIHIPNSIVHIGERAFGGCFNLSEIEIPESVLYIEDNVFANCTKLKTIVIKGTNTKLQYRAFSNCPAQSILVPIGMAERYKKMLPKDVHNVIKEQG